MIKEITIDRNSGLPVSSQIAHFLRQRIVSSDIKPGDKLPTTREIVELFGVGSHTVRAAMARLAKEGLVESSPKRGTFVTFSESGNGKGKKNKINENKRLEGESKDAGFRRIAVMSAFGLAGGNKLYRPETIAGILKEAERQNVVAQIFPETLRGADEEYIYKTIVSNNIDGVIWPTPEKNEWVKIDYLISQNIPVVASRRVRCNDSRSCVESNYDIAGYEAGKLLLNKGCDKVLFFTFDEYPISIRHGLSRAFEDNGLVPTELFSFMNLTVDDKVDIRSMLTELEGIDKNTSIVFTNGYHYLELLKSHGLKAREILSNHHHIVLSNKTISVQMAPLMDGLNPMVLVDPFEDIGKLSLQKVLGIIDGYLAGSTTLAGIKIKEFSDLGL